MRSVPRLCPRRQTFLSTLGVAVLLSASTSLAGQATRFKIRIDNISTGDVLRLSAGGAAPFAVSPGIWMVHTGSTPVFKSSAKDRGQGLEAQAEDGNPARTVWRWTLPAD